MYSPDTDVFLLLIHFYQSLPQSLLFHTGRGKDARKINIASCYEGIGPRYAKALLGFHVFTGCDQTGRFSRKTKTFWWKEFQKADDDTLDALAQLGKKMMALNKYDVPKEKAYFSKMYLNFDVKRFAKYSFSYRTSQILATSSGKSSTVWCRLN